MMNTIAEFLRKHALAAAISGLGVGVTGALGVGWSLYEARSNRVEEMKVKALQEISEESVNFQSLLNEFTAELSQDNVADPDKKKQLANSLVKLYGKYGEYTVNLPPNEASKVKSVQTSLNEVKKQVQSAKKKTDLEGLGTALVEMFRSRKTLQPALEQSVGRGANITG